MFAGVSEQGRSDPKPTTRDTNPHAAETAASHKTSQPEAPQSSPTPSNGSSASVTAPRSEAASQSTTSATNVQTPSEATPSSVVLPPSTQAIPGPIAMQAALLAGTISAAPSGSLISNSASTSAGLAAPARAAGKQGKAKAPSAQNGAGAAVAALATIPNQSIVAAVNLASWQGNGHGQGDNSSTTSSKTVAVSASTSVSKGTYDVSAKPLAGALDGTMTPTVVPADVPVSNPNIAAQGNGVTSNVAMDIPLASISPNSDAANPSPGQPTSMASSSHSVVAKNPNLMSALDAGKGSTGNPGDTSFHSVQSDGQTVPSPPVDASKAAVTTQRPPDSGVSLVQAQSVAMHVASHETAPAQHMTNSVAETSASAKSQEVPVAAHVAAGDVAASSGVNTAKLIQTMGESEMHVGMRSTEFGDISIRTTMSQQQMVTQISLSHNDLSQAISAHVATVQAKLGEDYGLPTSIVVNNQGSPLSGESGNSSRQEQQPYSRFTGSESSMFSAGGDGEKGLGMATHAGSGHGLDIRI